jgi:hypothetical protein
MRHDYAGIPGYFALTRNRDARARCFTVSEEGVTAVGKGQVVR